MSWISRSLGLAFVVCAATPGLAQRWSYTADGTGQYWQSKAVDFGDGDTQVFSTLGTGFPSLLLSSFDRGTAAPAWQEPNPGGAFLRAQDSAQDADVHAALTLQGTTLTLRRYDSHGEIGAGYAFPYTAYATSVATVRVSRDGGRIVVAAYDSSVSDLRVYVFSRTSGGPIASRVHDTGIVKLIDVDEDARRIVAAGIYVRVFDATTGATLQSQLTGTVSACAISPDGRRFAYGLFGNVHVYEQPFAGGAYAFQLQTPYSGTLAELEFAAEAPVLGIASDEDDLLRVQVKAVDCATHAVRMTRTITGYSPAGYQNFTMAMDVSRDGSRLALAVSGDETGAADEVQVFNVLGGANVASFDLPGSAMDLDLSADGRHLAVATRSGHVNVLQSGGGGLSVYDLEPRAIDLMTAPRAGQPIQFAIHGVEQGDAANMLWATEEANPPRYYPRLGGVLYLKRSRTRAVHLAQRTYVDGELTATGWGTLQQGSFPVPAGQEVLLQGLTSTLGDEWMRVRLLP